MSHEFKQIAPTDKFGWHKALLPVYERLLRAFKDTPDSIVEIGCDGGGGALMYADYFWLARSIVSCDVSPRPASLDGDKRIIHLQADAYAPNGWHQISKRGPFALIVDDGPHTVQSQRIFCTVYPPMLADYGIAIVEDIQDPKTILLLKDATPPGFETMAIDVRHVTGRYDDLIFCIWKETP